MTRIYISLIFVLTLLTSVAQQFEGTITYSIKYLSLPEEVKGMESMLPSEMKMHLKGTKMCMEQDVMGGSQTVISDEVTKDNIVLMDMMGQKMAIKSNSSEDFEASKPTFEYFDETKTVAGYSCKKAVSKVPGGEPITIWYTTKFKANHNFGTDLKGFPLMYETNEAGMHSLITATTIQAGKVNDTKFEIPDDFTIMTNEELQQMMGGGE